MKGETLRQLLADKAAERPVVLATNLTTGAERLFYPLDPAGTTDPLAAQGREALMLDQSTTVPTADGPIFLHAFNTPLRMILIGAVHISQPLARMAAMAGYDVVVVDPRRAFAHAVRFPGLKIVTDWPDDAMRALHPDHRTAVVALTHDPKLDDPALQVALRSRAFYIGALGSKKTAAKRVERLTVAGLTAAEIGRIRGPVGLDINARSPAEIAISVLAEVTQVLRTEVAQAQQKVPA